MDELLLNAYHGGTNVATQIDLKGVVEALECIEVGIWYIGWVMTATALVLALRCIK